jgi:hypothetical protein
MTNRMKKRGRMRLTRMRRRQWTCLRLIRPGKKKLLSRVLRS